MLPTAPNPETGRAKMEVTKHEASIPGMRETQCEAKAARGRVPVSEISTHRAQHHGRAAHHASTHRHRATTRDAQDPQPPERGESREGEPEVVDTALSSPDLPSSARTRRQRRPEAPEMANSNPSRLGPEEQDPGHGEQQQYQHQHRVHHKAALDPE